MSLHVAPGIYWDDLPFLRDKALDLLSAGPATAPTLAERLFAASRISPRIAAFLVREVLGDDPRFRIKGSRWLLNEAWGSYGSTPLAEMDFVIVDVEATGGSPLAGGRITELAAVRVSQAKIVDDFETLLNPEQPIPAAVTRLTNITDEMVAGAPRFSEMAEEIQRRLQGAVFVAHNAHFDWDFLQSEFSRCRRGRLDGRRICTLRLARRLHPELERKNLPALADYYSISMDGWHRAGPDAQATARIFVQLLDRLAEEGVERWGCLEAFLNGNGRGSVDGAAGYEPAPGF